MDSSHVSHTLDQLLKQMEQFQSLPYKLDNVIKCFNNVNCILEGQNQRIHSLEAKLYEMIPKREEVTSLMEDPPRDARHDTLKQLGNVPSQTNDAFSKSPLSISGTGEAVHKPTQAMPDWINVITDFKEKLERLDQKTNFIKTQVIETSQTCHNLVRSRQQSEAQLEEKLAGIDKERENIKICLSQILSIPETIKGLTRGEFVWLEREIDQKLSHISEHQRQIKGTIEKQQQHIELCMQQNQKAEESESKIENIQRTTQNIETLIEAILNKLTSQNIKSATKLDDDFQTFRKEVSREEQATGDLLTVRSEEIKMNLKSCHEKAKIESEDDKKPSLQELTTSKFARAHEFERVKGEIAHLNPSILSLAGQLTRLEKSMGTILQKIEGREINLDDGHKIMTSDVPSLEQEQDRLESNEGPSNQENTDGSQKNKIDIPAATQNIETLIEAILIPLTSQNIKSSTELDNDSQTFRKEVWRKEQATDDLLTVEPSNKDNTDGSHRNKTDVPAVSKTEPQICNDRTHGPLSPIAISKLSEPTQVDLLLIGKTGNGKSAAGNSILRRKAFKSRSSTKSVTQTVNYEVSEFNGRVIKVVDGPGVGDTRMNSEKAVNLVFGTMEYAIAANPSGYHAFCLVMRYGGRFTEEDNDTIDFLKKMFGKDFVKMFCILVLTCGDKFEKESEESGQTFEEWCKEQEGVFKELLNECENRIVLFDNATKDERKKKEQVAKLLEIVDNLSSHGKRYTEENFRKAEEARVRIIVESQIPMIQEETMKETFLILQQLENIQLEADLDKKVPLLEQLLIRAEAIKESIISRDRGTGALHELKSHVKSIIRSVSDEILFCYRMKKEQERIRRHEEEIQRKYEEELREKEYKAFVEDYKKVKAEIDRGILGGK